MYSTNEIMKMLDWNQSEDVQANGRMLAKEIKFLNLFIQPYDPDSISGGKNLWDNCALILSEKNDEELKPYIPELLRWLQDLNHPGAECIKRRLTTFKDKEWLEYWLDEAIETAKINDYQWLLSLNELKSNMLP